MRAVRSRRVTAAAVLLAGGVLCTPGTALADHAGDVDCGDFDYYEDALAHLQAHPGDPDGLDDEGDGQPCELLPRRNVAAPAPVTPPPPVAPQPAPCVYGAIADRYASLGGSGGFLGTAVTCEAPTQFRPGRYNDFQGGSIYWSSATGAWEVHGRIRDKWVELGKEGGPLGFPVSNETPLADGAVNGFEGGRISWSPRTDAHEVRGAILGVWAETGLEAGILGYPTSDETPTPLLPGRYNHFEDGSVYWSPTTGAYAITGDIRDYWADLGWENSYLGFPTSAEYPLGDGQRRQEFQGGTITWSPTGGGPAALTAQHLP